MTHTHTLHKWTHMRICNIKVYWCFLGISYASINTNNIIININGWLNTQQLIFDTRAERQEAYTLYVVYHQISLTTILAWTTCTFCVYVTLTKLLLVSVLTDPVVESVVSKFILNIMHGLTTYWMQTKMFAEAHDFYNLMCKSVHNEIHW